MMRQLQVNGIDLSYEVVLQCIPSSRLVVMPKATHLMSHQNPTAFNEALLHFLAQP